MRPCAAAGGKMAADGGPAAGGPPAPRPVSFGFTRTAARRRLAEPGAGGAAPEPDFVSAVEGSELRSLRPAPAPQVLVVPLIQRNQWKKPETPAAGPPDRPGDEGVESQAVREIIEECRQSQERWESGSKADPSLAIPLLLQNRVPDGYEDGSRVDVSLRPESATEADYEVVPVEAYGIAMLRGMGWKEGEGIGCTFKQDVKPLEHQLRPRGLGLGADRSAIQDLQVAGPRRPPKPGEERRGGEEEPLGLVAGGAVLIAAGPHKDLYGKIAGVDPDNARAMVKLAIGDKMVTVSQHGLRAVTQKEYERHAKDLSCFSKAQKEKEEKQRNGATDVPDARRQDKGEEKDRKRKQPAELESDARAVKQSKGSSRGSSSSSAPHWLQRDLRVRFVDKLYKRGKYYNTKMLIEDVLSPDTCVCRTEEGRVLDDIQEAMLETVIPRGAADRVMVVLGEHAGKVGQILQRDHQRSQALVQLQGTEDGDLLALDYDAVCQYVGGMEDD
ncbi:G-patch domain and KOW motifs-containing protein [Emydura macquarii macquarii]|uniref:G-patch domain and KOW motifs-containing protein n=1 Tax=Emydura macquarii macquarii TaxID=1129001 RepID=UPI00352A629C